MPAGERPGDPRAHPSCWSGPMTWTKPWSHCRPRANPEKGKTLMLPRFAKLAYNRHYWSPPRDATHVLQWFPSALLQPEDRDPGIPGWWEIWPLVAFLAGEPDVNAPDEAGSAD